MNNKELRHLLKNAYSAPQPRGKEDFLRAHQRSEIGYWKLLTMQIRYMRPFVWLISIALFAMILILTEFLDWTRMWIASALTPFLALIVITVNSQSERYGMAEWELASRFSLQSITIARMLILGIFHLGLLAVLSPILAHSCSIGFMRTSVYLLVPYVASGTAGLALSRKFHGDETLYASALSAVILSFLFGLSGVFFPAAYKMGRFNIWIVLLAVLLAALLHEVHFSVKKIGGIYEAYC